MTNTRAICKRFATLIDDVMADEDLDRKSKQIKTIELAQDCLAAIGSLFLVGGLPAHINAETGEILRLLVGMPDLDRFLKELGFLPGADDWDRLLFRTLQARTDIPRTFVHSIAHFDTEANALFLNEWNGGFLRLTNEGVSRHKVGEFGVLFDKGDDPHPPLDLAELNAKIKAGGPALAWNEDSPLVRHVFGIGAFAETSGLGRTHCITSLLTFTMAIFFAERVRVLPVVHLHGLSGSKKTSICVALGQVTSGLGMEFSPTACPDSVADVANCLINAKGLLVLDEANALRPLTSLIKATVTGAKLKRRVLYTTAAEQTFPVDAALMIPANFDSATDESLVNRCLRISMGDPGNSGEGWRGDYHVRQEWVRLGIRQQCWEEIVLRCASAMRFLSLAASKGEDDIRVSNRMSGFWTFAIAIASQEGEKAEQLVRGAMDATTAEQRRSVSNFDDVLPLLQKWLDDAPEDIGKRLTAAEIGSRLLNLTEATNGNGHHVTQPMQLSKTVRDILQSALRMSNKLTGTAEYHRLLGLQIFNGRTGKLFSFHPPASAEPAKVQP